MRYLFLSIFASLTVLCFSQNQTDVSLFIKEDPGNLLSEIYSESGDLYQTLWHHGPAILFNPADFVQQKDDGTQKLLISGPTKQVECWITSANAKEPKIYTLEKFVKFLDRL